MDLLRLEKAHLHYGTQVLLDGVDLQITRGQRLGLLGRNGEGKSTLLRVLAGELAMDSGERWLRPGTRIARLEQELPEASDLTLYDYVASGLAETGELLKRYAHLAADPNADLKELERVQHALEAADGWQLEQRVQTTLTQLGLEGDSRLAELSGGWRRRVGAGARAGRRARYAAARRAHQPPGHRDHRLAGGLPARLRGSLLFVTHDRRFLRRLATISWSWTAAGSPTGPATTTTICAAARSAPMPRPRSHARFDKRLAEEERLDPPGHQGAPHPQRGPRAGAQGHARRAPRAPRPDRQGAAAALDSAERSGKLVAEAEGVGFAWGETPGRRGLDTLILRGDRVGIIGPNGAGKSTLLKLLLGELAPDSGASATAPSSASPTSTSCAPSSIRPRACATTSPAAATSDRHRRPRKARAVLSEGLPVHAPDRAQQPVSALSGGERNRLLLARLFTQPANLLVLDEPTNDLDAETLELLEELLQGFDGTLLLVSHDRDLIDNVVTTRRNRQHTRVSIRALDRARGSGLSLGPRLQITLATAFAR
jgi:ATP-binding cassette subfamily F protein uup